MPPLVAAPMCLPSALTPPLLVVRCSRFPPLRSASVILRSIFAGPSLPLHSSLLHPQGGAKGGKKKKKGVTLHLSELQGEVSHAMAAFSAKQSPQRAWLLQERAVGLLSMLLKLAANCSLPRVLPAVLRLRVLCCQPGSDRLFFFTMPSTAVRGGMSKPLLHCPLNTPCPVPLLPLIPALPPSKQQLLDPLESSRVSKPRQQQQQQQLRLADFPSLEQATYAADGDDAAACVVQSDAVMDALNTLKIGEGLGGFSSQGCRGYGCLMVRQLVWVGGSWSRKDFDLLFYAPLTPPPAPPSTKCSHALPRQSHLVAGARAAHPPLALASPRPPPCSGKETMQAFTTIHTPACWSPPYPSTLRPKLLPPTTQRQPSFPARPAGIDNPRSSNVLLIECVDMYMLEQKEVDPAAHFMGMCSSYGEVVEVAVFRSSEAVAVTMASVDDAITTR